eukprot:TRINITY_DN6760_c0_g1_i3.p1 TRINITY_DN6760_c0_g1~~TRINITY_DN6760_c0_g1_i3.p1  ORF type:complete len:1429 (-),score=274.05 TRINITY_DN6760_c0_g1_i3:316-4602(-)
MFSKLKDWNAKPNGEEVPQRSETDLPVESSTGTGIFSKLKQSKNREGSVGSTGSVEDPAASGKEQQSQTAREGGGGGMFGKLMQKRTSREMGSDEEGAVTPRGKETARDGRGGLFSKITMKKARQGSEEECASQLTVVEEVQASVATESKPKEVRDEEVVAPEPMEEATGIVAKTDEHSTPLAKLKATKASKNSGASAEDVPATVPGGTNEASPFAKLKGNKGIEGSVEDAPASAVAVASDASQFEKLKGTKGSAGSVENIPPAVILGSEDASQFSKLKGTRGNNGSNGSVDDLPSVNYHDNNASLLSKLKGRKGGSASVEEDPVNDLDMELDPEEKDIEIEDYSGSGSGSLEDGYDGVDGGDLANMVTDGGDIDVTRFDELSLQPTICQEARYAWDQFIDASGSRVAAGEAIYSALLDGVPMLQEFFTTPRAVQSVRFVNSFHSFVYALENPPALKVLVEAIAFGHLNMDVSVEVVCHVRASIIDLLEVDLGDVFSPEATIGWRSLLNYIGGAIVFVKQHYAERLRILAMTWEEANAESGIAEAHHDGTKQHADEHDDATKTAGRDDDKERGDEHGDEETAEKSKTKKSGATVPKTFPEMFMFNCAVMGFGTNTWMAEILRSFDTVVRNVANPARLQDECDVLALRISKQTKEPIKLSEFKSCMLASMRGLLPKLWEPAFEVAWAWLWDNVERLLSKSLGSPPIWEKALLKMLNSISEGEKYELRAAIFARFFDLAPLGQDYFKQSNTRLHFIADRVFTMTMVLYKDPAGTLEEISAVGLRHVGYAIPTELIGPFVTSCVEILSSMTQDVVAMEAFRWSLGLIAKILGRTVTEGSTIVMKAITQNSPTMLKMAMCSAPRASRASWLLLIQVGSQKISPLLWAIESGSLESADAMIVDLLTIRADRERYYYGVNDLFVRHPDFIFKLCADAPTLLPTLLAGLSWRSRQTTNNLRRVNYYVEHLLVTREHEVSPALEWLAASKDVKIVAHPIIAFVSDTLWAGVVRRQFTISKLWFVFSLLIFLVSQAVLPKFAMNPEGTANLPDTQRLRWYVLVGRALIYCVTLGRLSWQHMTRTGESLARLDCFAVFGLIPVPNYMKDKYLLTGFVLMCMLLGMFSSEPLLACFDEPDWPTEICESVKAGEFRYAVFAMMAMVSLWLLVIDMSVFSTKLSAFVLMCGHVLQEVGRFLVALMFLLMTFASAISVLRTAHGEFKNVPNAVIALFAVTVGIYEKDFRELDGEGVLLAAIFLFIAASAILLLNLLIAQLNCSYEFVYADMVGFARMNRAQLIVETLTTCPPERWDRFVASLNLDVAVEFDEGDVGPPGGMQILEPMSTNPVLVDQIIRFGGSCAPDAPWPEEIAVEEESKLDRIETLVKKVIKRKQKSEQSKSGGGSGSDKMRAGKSMFNSGGSDGSQCSMMSDGSVMDDE